MTSNNWQNLSLQDLEKAVQHHNRLYWIENNPEISDPEFDRMVERLRELDPDSPMLHAIGPAGAVDEVASALDEALDPELEKCVHDPPMLSLDKCYDEATLLKWFEKFEGQAVATPKIDGVAASIRYDADGNFLLAATRGNGSVGEIVTDNVRQIVGLPLKVDIPNLEVRGEAYMPVSVFEKHFKDVYLSPRNLTAGALKLKDASRVAQYQIHFFAYDMLAPALDGEIQTEIDKLKRLHAMGFEAAAAEVVHDDALQAAFDQLEAMRAELRYETDGVVFKTNLISEQRRLGHTAHHPRYAIAYKFQGDADISTLREVHWSVSRTGAINPVGIVDPVTLSGAVVTRVSLHNLAIMEQLGGEQGLHLNSKVLMMRRGGVIPNLERVLETGDILVEIPTHCPGCGQETYRQNDFLYAHHAQDCRSARIKQIEHFASVMELKGFGPKLLEALYDARFITEPADFYTLTVEQMCSIERVGPKLAERQVNRIAQKREVPVETFLRALGIDELGRHVSKILATHFQSLDEILAVQPEQLAEIPTIGDIIAQKVTDGLQTHRVLIDDLLQHIQLIFPAPQPEDAQLDETENTSPLYKKSVLFTGALESMKRSEAAALVEARGGSTPSSVVRTLDYLVIGDADFEKFQSGWRSSKLKQAEQYNAQGGNIQIIGEQAFLKLLDN